MWNNRIIEHNYLDIYPNCKDKSPPKFIYGLHEVFYSADGHPTSCTMESLYGYFESIEDLEGTLSLVCRDLERFKGKPLNAASFKTKSKKPKPSGKSGKSFNSAAELFADLDDKPAPHKHFSQKIRESAPQIAAGVFKNKFEKKK